MPIEERRPSAPKESQNTNVFPSLPLDETIPLPHVIYSHFGGVSDLDSACSVMGIDSKGPRARRLLESARAYGLVQMDGSTPLLVLTDLGLHLFTAGPFETAELRVNAVMANDAVRKFFEKYRGLAFPKHEEAISSLLEMGLSRNQASAVLPIIEENGMATGLIRVPNDGQPIILSSLRPNGFERISPATDETQNAGRRQISKEKRDDSTFHDEDASRSNTVRLKEGRPGSLSTSVISPDQSAPSKASQYDDSLHSQGGSWRGALSKDLVVDCYKLVKRLGAGYSAEVWSAKVERVPPGTELHPGQNVAIKFYRGHAMALADQSVRIEREYRIAQTIRHPHLIRIYEFVLASPRPHHNFLVMEEAKGVSLRSYLQDNLLDEHQTLKVLSQLFSAAEALHDASALHRDIKPNNIAIEVKANRLHTTLLDLGIVSIAYEKGVTVASRFLGSKHWAPLEQLVGGTLDERSDLYSIGAVAYNILSRREPFEDYPTEAAVAIAMSSQSLELPTGTRIPTPVLAMINACLESDRNARPRDARECLDVLQEFL